MSIQNRLLLLIICYISLVFGVFYYFQERNEKQMLEWFYVNKEEVGKSINRTLDTHSKFIQTAAYDYSYWDEMVTFVKSKDLKWAEENLNETLNVYGVQCVWVLSRKFEHIYSRKSLGEKSLEHFPLSSMELEKMFEKDFFCHFYILTRTGIVEIYGAPIQPTKDTERKTEPKGFFFVGRFLDNSYTHTMEADTSTTMSISFGENRYRNKLQSDSPNEGMMVFSRPLRGWDGMEIARLAITYVSPAFPLIHRTHHFHTMYWLVFVQLLVLVMGAGVYRWVTRPLKKISEILWDTSALSDTETIPKKHRETLDLLEKEKGEAGQIAVLIRLFFMQKEEIGALQKFRQNLAHVLHDGAIQTLYAIGLSLDVTQHQAKILPEKTEAHIKTILNRVNDLIRELRFFISSLESVTPEGVPVKKTICSAIEEFRWLAKDINVTIELFDEGVSFDEISVHAIFHIYYIVREGISNAIRHSSAKHVKIFLSEKPGFLVMEIWDDGKGLPEQMPLRPPEDGGHGLANIRSRAEAMNAKVEISSAPEQGTKIALEIPREKPTVFEA